MNEWVVIWETDSGDAKGSSHEAKTEKAEEGTHQEIRRREVDKKEVERPGAQSCIEVSG